jgi:hypothetical protein
MAPTGPSPISIRLKLVWKGEKELWVSEASNPLPAKIQMSTIIFFMAISSDRPYSKRNATIFYFQCGNLLTCYLENILRRIAKKIFDTGM